MFTANIFSSLFGWVTSNVEAGAIGIVLIVLGWVAKKYLLPYLNTTLRKKLAEYVLIMADEITDQLVAKYPDKDLLVFLDKAVDKLMEVCGVSQEVAERAVQAAIGRKGLKIEEK